MQTPVSMVVDGSQSPAPRRRRSSQLPPRPLAVLEVINKRGKGIFTKHDEDALVSLCTCVESLLRRKAAEVSLLWSGMTERSLMRKGDSPGGTGAPTNYARVESTIMRLYSKVPCPNDPVALGEQRARRRNSRVLGDDGGGSGGGGSGGGEDSDGGGDRDRSARDRKCLKKARSDSGGDSVRPGGGIDSTVSATAAAAHGGGGGRSGGIDRIFMGQATQEESELVDLGMNLFELSSDQLLSLVGRFFRNMGLTDLFQVCLCVGLFGLVGPFASGSAVPSCGALPGHPPLCCAAFLGSPLVYMHQQRIRRVGVARSTPRRSVAGWVAVFRRAWCDRAWLKVAASASTSSFAPKFPGAGRGAGSDSGVVMLDVAASSPRSLPIVSESPPGN